MKRITLLAIAAALGLALALGLTARTADAYDVHALPAGYSVLHAIGSSSGPCNETWFVSGYNQSINLCADSATFQQDLDAFVSATCPVTVCVPPVTTTAAAPPITTDAQPPVTTSETVTVTTVVTDPTIETRLAALEANYATLAKRVNAISQANTASWDAFKAAIDGGASVSDAALAARSAGENAIFQLG